MNDCHFGKILSMFSMDCFFKMRNIMPRDELLPRVSVLEALTLRETDREVI